jgi:TonB family protein
VRYYFKIALFCFVITPRIFSQADTALALAQIMPEFPGGTIELTKFIEKNANYPVEAREKGETGKAYIRLIIDTNGKVISPRILKSSGSKSINEEALRVVKSMPRWTPGIENGNKVNVYITLPVGFNFGSPRPDSTRVSGFSLGRRTAEEKSYAAEENSAIRSRQKATYYYNEGLSRARQNKYQEALEKFDACLKTDSVYVDALFNKGIMHFKLGEKRQACNSWTKVLGLKKDDKETEELIKKYCN